MRSKCEQWTEGGLPRLWTRAIGALGLVLCLFASILVGESPRIAEAQGPGDMRGFPDLVKGLEATQGCLGVETARTRSGKQVIFAWFEDKAAALRWYKSDMHRGAQDHFFPKRPPHKPLQGVPDKSGPILAIASITMSDSSHFAQTSMPISQIAIELYQPLPGGVFLGSRFAPASVKVSGMLDYTPQPSGK